MHCLLDNMLDGVNQVPKDAPYLPWAIKLIKQARYTARRFIFDAEASESVGHIMQNNMAMIAENAEFAKQPYETMYMEFDARAVFRGRGGKPDHTSDDRIGFLCVGEWTFLTIEGPQHQLGRSQNILSATAWRLNHPQKAPMLDIWKGPIEQAYSSKIAYVFGGQWRGNSIVVKPLKIDHRKFVDNSIDVVSIQRKVSFDISYAVTAGGDPMLELTALLLLNRPSDQVILKDVGPSRGFHRNKSVAFAAHTVVNITLAAKVNVRRLLIGDRASPRRHDVRGHWMHWHHVRSCEHAWIRLDHDGEKFRCETCGTLRVWKKNFLRGDGSRGVTTKDYAVHP